MARLGGNRYGKAGVRLVRVDRRAERHALRDLTVAVALQGDFTAAHVSGDNARILPTDTMKNTVYALALEHLTGSLEAFGAFLGEHFLNAAPITGARIRMQEHAWRRIAVNGREHAHSFAQGSADVRTAQVTTTSSGIEIKAGIKGLNLLKTTRSGFVGYLRDSFTTLPETTDRILATTLNAQWVYAGPDVDYDEQWSNVRTAIEETFAQHDSLSVQHTLYAMGEVVLQRCPPVTRIRFSLPNKHHLLVDLARFGLANRNQIFVATREPYGLIEAEVLRD